MRRFRSQKANVDIGKKATAADKSFVGWTALHFASAGGQTAAASELVRHASVEFIRNGRPNTRPYCSGAFAATCFDSAIFFAKATL